MMMISKRFNVLVNSGAPAAGRFLEPSNYLFMFKMTNYMDREARAQ